MKNAVLLLLSNLCLAVLTISCQNGVSKSKQHIFYEDIILGLSINVDLTSMNFSRGIFIDDVTFCDANSNFKCVLKNDVAWVAIPRGLNHMDTKSWEFGGFKFSSMPVKRMFKCENNERQKWIKVKRFTDEYVDVFFVSENGEIKSFGTEIPQKDFKKEVIGNVDEGDVLGYESLFLAVDGCGIRMP